MNSHNRKNPTLLSDEDIINLYWNRNEKAISETDHKYGRYLFTIAYNILHDNMDCEECVNDTYFSTWNRIPPTRPNVFQVFLSKITRNVAVDKYRKEKAEKRIPSEMINSLDELGDCIPDSTNVEEMIFIKKASELLNEYLFQLNKKESLVFVCRYYYCDSIETIARMLKVSESTIYRMLAKMRAELKEKLAKEGYYA